MEDGARSIEVLCDIAAERGLMVDMHCDETDDPTVAPHRNARRRDAAARPARPRHRLAPHLHAQHGQLLRVEAAAADGRGAGARGRQPADQHRAAGPPRHLSEAARPDARAGDARARYQRGVRPRLRDGPVVLARLRRHARCRAHGAACRADDLARGDALLLRCGDDERREDHGARRLRARCRRATAISWCCRPPTRSRRSGSRRGGCSSCGAAR